MVKYGAPEAAGPEGTQVMSSPEDVIRRMEEEGKGQVITTDQIEPETGRPNLKEEMKMRVLNNEQAKEPSVVPEAFEEAGADGFEEDA